MIAIALRTNFVICKNKRIHLKIASEKRAGPVISVVIVLSPKPVETNTLLVCVKVHRNAGTTISKCL